jgi:hypothetical protein
VANQVSWLKELYPDLHAAGGLRAALQSQLPSVVLEPPADYPGFPPDRGYGVGAVAGDRSIGANLGSEERAFVGEFWEAGVCLGGYVTTLLSDVADLIERWLSVACRASELTSSETLALTLRPSVRSYESGPEAYVTFRWQDLLRSSRDARISHIAAAAANIPVLRGLYPFTSHSTLHFSRCTGFPFSPDCPSIAPVENGLYTVFDPSGEPIGTGSADEMAALAAACLPPEVGSAVPGPWHE